MRNKAELAAVKMMLGLRGATIWPLSEAITQRATELIEILILSHGLQLGDALIAATALCQQMPPHTGNVKHFATVGGLHRVRGWPLTMVAHAAELPAAAYPARRIRL